MTDLPASVARPAYDRDTQKAGIIHFGIGAFHRAHQAVYADDAMNAGERDWGIMGISLRSASVREQLNPQDGLYTVAERSSEGSRFRLIGSVQKVLVAMFDTEAVSHALSAPTTHIVSFTITEKGYCRAPDGALDLNLNEEVSIYTYLTAAFRRRREAGLPGLSLLSCDNLANNGTQLQRLMKTYLEHNAPDLIGWFDDHCTCPSTMVDRIVPATTQDDRSKAESELGIRDEAHVVTEPFSQWVIEDKFAGRRPHWEDYGADLVADVTPYETAKLRMLNGAHSALAYIGLAAGHEYVHQAIADPVIRPLIERLMREEAAPSIDAAPGQDLNAYANALLTRFENSALNHRLIQIAMDGSQKIPQRWLETLAHHQGQLQHCPAILTGLAAWLLHVRGDARPVDDPLAPQLASQWQRARQNGIANLMFGPEGILASDWKPSEVDYAFIANKVRGLE